MVYSKVISHPLDLNFNDPLFGKDNLLSEIEVIKIFKSAARPYLLRFTYDDGEEKFAIFKKGDDLRFDLKTQVMLWIFNKLWDYTLFDKKPFTHQYRILPMDLTQGLIECVENSVSLNEYAWSKVRDPEGPLKAFLIFNF